MSSESDTSLDYGKSSKTRIKQCGESGILGKNKTPRLEQVQMGKESWGLRGSRIDC
jgi:hypothetical protein